MKSNLIHFTACKVPYFHRNSGWQTNTHLVIYVAQI